MGKHKHNPKRQVPVKVGGGAVPLSPAKGDAAGMKRATVIRVTIDPRFPVGRPKGRKLVLLRALTEGSAIGREIVRLAEDIPVATASPQPLAPDESAV